MKMALCFSHHLTAEQERDARDNLHIKQFLPLPESLGQELQQVPPEPDVPEEILANILLFLEQNTAAGDYVLIQSEFGITWAVVDWCARTGRIPVYCTTRREYVRRDGADGSVINTHTFSHVRFRRYFNCEGKAL